MARKRLKMGKKALCLIFAFLLSIESFGSVISSSDGGAFVTKQEFETLKDDFNSQLDRYNKSIDNKIDGSIAAYINGLRVTKQTEEKNLCYEKDGILSPRANLTDLKWKEGIMAISLRMNGGFLGTNDLAGATTQAWAYTYLDLKPQNPTEFTELLIKNVNYDKNNAEWRGVSQTRQYINGTAFDIVNGDYNTTPYYILSLHNGVYRKQYPTAWTEMGTILHLASGPTIGDHQKAVSVTASNSAWKRETLSTETTNIICTPASAHCGRFCDFDTFYDWCYDTNASGHTVVTVAANLFANGLMYEMMAKTPNTRKMTYNEVTMDLTSESGKRSSNAYQYYRPFFGFSQKITNYNQLWTSKYDNLIASLLEYDDSISLAEDKDAKKHLWIAAGAPVLEVKHEDKVTIVCDFKDAANHDVWFKVGPFTKGVAVNSDNCIPRTNIYKGNSSSTTLAPAGSMSNSVRVNSGTKTTFTIDIPKDGILFIKWSIYGNSGAGGGTFISPEKVILSRA